MNCVIETSIVGSKDILRYTSLLPNLNRTPNETFKYVSTV